MLSVEVEELIELSELPEVLEDSDWDDDETSDRLLELSVDSEVVLFVEVELTELSELELPELVEELIVLCELEVELRSD